MYNEVENLTELARRVQATCDTLAGEWELIVVDDGSTDASGEQLRALHEEDSRIKMLTLSRNFGQSAALTAGLAASKGEAVVVLDADLQDPPELIPELVARWREGYEVVSGRRVRRDGQSPVKRASAYVFYRLMATLVSWPLPADTGEFRLLDRKVVDAFNACPQRHRLVRTLTSWSGFRQASVDYEQPARHAGRSKYSFRKSLRLALTSITSFSLAPLRLLLWLGMIIILLSSLAFAIAMTVWLMDGINWRVATLLSLWFIGGLQLFGLGILGEYVGRTYMETQHRPIYVVSDSLGLDEND
jgi:dolichol-phosphate mannosyltransferase